MKATASTNMKWFIAGLLIMFLSPAYALDLAITIDGLPAHGDLPANTTRQEIAAEVIHALKKHHIHGTYGFVVGNLITNADERAVLQQWLAAGNKLGNHSFSHWDIAMVNVDDYIADIQKTDVILSKLVKDNSYKYYRYPYLSEGETQEKNDAILHYLHDHQYTVAPVTVDFSDYRWNEAYLRCQRKQNTKAIAWLKATYLQQAVNGLIISHLLSEHLFHRDIKNILLLHIGAFEAMMLDDLLSVYKKENVKYVTLPQALSDDVYQYQPKYISAIGYPYLYKMELARKLDRPTEVRQLSHRLPVKELNEICM